jgi:hypothetical protein
MTGLYLQRQLVPQQSHRFSVKLCTVVHGHVDLTHSDSLPSDRPKRWWANCRGPRPNANQWIYLGSISSFSSSQQYRLLDIQVPLHVGLATLSLSCIVSRLRRRRVLDRQVRSNRTWSPSSRFAPAIHRGEECWDASLTRHIDSLKIINQEQRRENVPRSVGFETQPTVAVELLLVEMAARAKDERIRIERQQTWRLCAPEQSLDEFVHVE